MLDSPNKRVDEVLWSLIHIKETSKGTQLLSSFHSYKIKLENLTLVLLSWSEKTYFSWLFWFHVTNSDTAACEWHIEACLPLLWPNLHRHSSCPHKCFSESSSPAVPVAPSSVGQLPASPHTSLGPVEGGLWSEIWGNQPAHVWIRTYIQGCNLSG